MKSWGAALVLLAFGGESAGQVGPQQQPPPVQFETRADLILIDATVLDSQGAPIADLTSRDFIVSVDGRPRTIAAVQFVKSTAPPAAAARAKATHYSTNEGESDGRRIMIVVDENSIPPGGARAVLRSVERLLNDLSPADKVGFIRLPQFENSVDFTTDRQRVLESIKRTVGKAQRAGFGRVTVAEAAAYDRSDSVQWARAITRICSGSAPAAGQSAKPGASSPVDFSGADEFAFCKQGAENDAREQILTLQRRARETLNGLDQIVSNLRGVPGSKTLILLSQGFVSYDDRLQITRLADRAAAARVSLYALHIDMRSMDVDAVEASFTRMQDEQLMAEGLDILVGASRGARFRIVGTGEGVFARVARELSGYYLIGLEPTDADRDGRPHRIKVEVNRPKVTVRARAQFTMAGTAAADAATAMPGNQLVQLLRAATPDAGVPLRLAAFTSPSASPGRVNVILGADVGAPTVSPLELHVGYVLVDADGKLAADEFVSVVLRPDRATEPSVPRYIGRVEVPPGEYTVRFAVIDADGRTGSVHRPVMARVKHAGGVSVSDLVLTTPSRSGPVRPEVHVKLEQEALQATLELTASDPAQLRATRVTFEVSDKTDGAPMVSEGGVLGNTDGPVKPTGAVLKVGALPPGEYVARAVINVPGQRPLTATRPFEVAPRKRTARTAETSRSAVPAVSRGRARPPIPPFKPEDVLAPEVVNPFIDHVLATYSPSPAARDALNAIRAGNLRHAANGDRQVGDVGLSFARGLALLAENRSAEAHAYFRAALRSASDFIGAAFYLGATLAASGNDQDAVGAWQTALIGEVGAAGVYPVLIDGLLRLGEAERALETLTEAEPTFTDRAQYQRRLAQTHVLMGRYRDALPVAHEYLDSQPQDADMLFLTMHVIFEAHAADDLPEAAVELQKFRDYADRYIAAKGPQIPLVQSWRKALGIR